MLSSSLLCALCVLCVRLSSLPRPPKSSRAEIAGSAEGRRKNTRACGAGEWKSHSWVSWWRYPANIRRMLSSSLLCVLCVLCAKTSSPPPIQGGFARAGWVGGTVW